MWKCNFTKRSIKFATFSLFLSCLRTCESIVLDLQWSAVSTHFHSLAHAKLTNTAINYIIYMYIANSKKTIKSFY